MATKRKKNAQVEAWEIIEGWVETEAPKKSKHGKHSNITRGVEREPYAKIQHRKKAIKFNYHS